ncbi:MAG: imidazolonepropionase [Eubacteriales bacterium]|nr:imidazolonepropionase [Eubacteriales bacterium]
MLLIHNISLLQTPVGNESLRGEAQGENRKYRNASVLIDGETICAVAENGAIPPCPPDTMRLDARGAFVTPGWVDAHTHLVFGGWRQHEIPLKLRGAGYIEILQSGGGILDTVRQTRALGEDALFSRAWGFLDEQLRFGVTTTEIKSGYGLDLENECKQLRVIRRLKDEHAMDIVATCMAAHAVPPEFAGRTEAYVDYVCEIILPRVAKEHLAHYCDVFCETGVFSVEQSRRVLETARALGMGLKIHADEIDALGGALLAGELGAVSAEHLIATDDAGISALSAGHVIACLLPQTSLYLNKGFARAREMIVRNVAVCVASDFNPGSCPSLNLQLSANLAYLRYRMTPEETLTALTLNAACAIGLGNRLGSIEPGKQADLTLWNADGMELLCYRMGTNQVKAVVKRGKVVVG